MIRIPNARCRSAFFAGLVVSLTGCGQNIVRDMRPAQSGSAPAVRVSQIAPVYLAKVDGKSVDFVEFLPSNGQRLVLLAPGLHTLEVFYDDGRQHSVHHAEITFVADADHQYQASGWPPTLIDEATGKNAQQKLRVAGK